MTARATAVRCSSRRADDDRRGGDCGAAAAGQRAAGAASPTESAGRGRGAGERLRAGAAGEQPRRGRRGRRARRCGVCFRRLLRSADARPVPDGVGSRRVAAAARRGLGGAGWRRSGAEDGSARRSGRVAPGGVGSCVLRARARRPWMARAAERPARQQRATRLAAPAERAAARARRPAGAGLPQRSRVEPGRAAVSWTASARPGRQRRQRRGGRRERRADGRTGASGGGSRERRPAQPGSPLGHRRRGAVLGVVVCRGLLPLCRLALPPAAAPARVASSSACANVGRRSLPAADAASSGAAPSRVGAPAGAGRRRRQRAHESLTGSRSRAST